MFKIARLPHGLSRFSNALEERFLWDHFTYFRQLVLVMAFAWGRRTIANLYRYLEAQTHRSRFNHFLHQERCDPAVCLQLKAGPYGRNLYRRRPKSRLKVRKGTRTATYRFVDAGWLRLGDSGPVHVNFSRKDGDRKLLGIVADDPELTAEEIIEAYTHRWGIEVFFKDLKQHLGFGQYHNASY